MVGLEEKGSDKKRLPAITKITYYSDEALTAASSITY